MTRDLESGVDLLSTQSGEEKNTAALRKISHTINESALTFLAIIAAWLSASQGSQDGV